MGLRGGCNPGEAGILDLVQLAELFRHFNIFPTGLPRQVMRVGGSGRQGGTPAT